MSTTTISKKQKVVIEIPDDVFYFFTAKAKAKGTNLEIFLEHRLIKEMEDLNDEEAYAHLVKNDPDGLIPASEEEQQDFMEWLGVNRK
ncbi:MAG: hypothetical protein LBN29_12965 [Mediterranea sp.]|jgi:hypothetical protein|nr:hypothetical protein [Mediterranea sp.]